MNFEGIKKVLIIVLILNWLVAFSKIFIGFFTGTISILADGFHSLFDGVTNIIGLFGIRLAKKPADESHPYGYRKYEAIAATVIWAFLIITAYEIIRGIYNRIINPQQPEIQWFVLGILAGCIVIDYLVARYEYRKGRELKSTILVADSRHTKSHYITTGAVILGAILIKFGVPSIVDPIMASVVVVFIGRLIYEVFKETAAVLSDRAVVDQKRIKEIVTAVCGVESCHKVRSRGDESHVFLDIHLVLSSSLTLEEANKITTLVKEKVQEEIPEIQDITINLEPKNGCNCK